MKSLCPEATFDLPRQLSLNNGDGGYLAAGFNCVSSYVSLAIAACSFVGMTKTETLLSSALILASVALVGLFIAGSSSMPI